MRKPSQLTWILPIYLALLALIIPWYWPEGDSSQFYGFPIWVLVSLLALFISSCFTAWLCLWNGGSDK